MRKTTLPANFALPAAKPHRRANLQSGIAALPVLRPRVTPLRSAQAQPGAFHREIQPGEGLSMDWQRIRTQYEVLARGFVEHSPGLLEAYAESRMEGMRFFLVGVRSQTGDLEAAMPAFYVDHFDSLQMFPDGRIRSTLERWGTNRILGPVVDHFFKGPVLFGGLPICNYTPLLVRDGADRARLVRDLGLELARLGRALRAENVVIKDTQPEDRAAFAPLLSGGYRRYANLPGTRIDFKSEGIRTWPDLMRYLHGVNPGFVDHITDKLMRNDFGNGLPWLETMMGNWSVSDLRKPTGKPPADAKSLWRNMRERGPRGTLYNEIRRALDLLDRRIVPTLEGRAKLSEVRDALIKGNLVPLTFDRTTRIAMIEEIFVSWGIAEILSREITVGPRPAEEDVDARKAWEARIALKRTHLEMSTAIRGGMLHGQLRVKEGKGSRVATTPEEAESLLLQTFQGSAKELFATLSPENREAFLNALAVEPPGPKQRRQSLIPESRTVEERDALLVKRLEDPNDLGLGDILKEASERNPEGVAKFLKALVNGHFVEPPTIGFRIVTDTAEYLRLMRQVYPLYENTWRKAEKKLEFLSLDFFLEAKRRNPDETILLLMERNGVPFAFNWVLYDGDRRETFPLRIGMDYDHSDYHEAYALLTFLSILYGLHRGADTYHCGPTTLRTKGQLGIRPRDLDFYRLPLSPLIRPFDRLVSGWVAKQNEGLADREWETIKGGLSGVVGGP